MTWRLTVNKEQIRDVVEKWVPDECVNTIHRMLVAYDNENDAFDWLTTRRGADRSADFAYLRAATIARQPIQNWLDYEREELGMKVSDRVATIYVYERWCMGTYRKLVDGIEH